MTKITDQYQTRTPVDLGSSVIAEVPNNVINLPSTISASATVTSSLIQTCGFKNWIIGLLMTENGQVDVDYFADTEGNWQIGTSSMTVTANAASTTVIPNKIGVQSIQIRVTNNSSSNTATISNSYLALQAS